MGQQSIAHKISYLQKMADQFLILISGTALPLPTGSLCQATFSCRAATKEIQRVIDAINDGTLYLRGPYVLVRILCEERAHAN